MKPDPLRPASLRALLPLLGAALLGAALPAGAITYNLQGFVKTPSGTGIGGVTVDLYDPADNTKATAIQNVTLANGQYNAFFTPVNPAADFFYVDFAPVPQTGSAAVQWKDVKLTAATVVLPDAILPASFDVSVDVWDTTGTLPQANVDLDFYDIVTGLKVYTPGVQTGGGGNATADIPAGVYDILATPPRAGPFGPARLNDVRVTGPLNLSVNLPGGSAISGTVSDSVGNLLDLVSITVREAATGQLLATRYRTNAGLFDFFLPAGTYDLGFEAPAATLFRNVSVPAYVVPGAALNIVLPSGTALTGRVTDGAAVPLWQARIALEDAVTGIAADLARARTDTTGAFRIAAPSGVWDVTVSPPAGTRLLPKVLPHETIAATPRDLGTIVLDAGLLVTGRVTGGGQPVPDVNVNVRDARTGEPVATSGDHTDLNGNFRVVLRSGTYDFEFLPPSGGLWLPAARRAVTVSTDMSLTPDIVLVAGARVTATVVGQGAGPLEGAGVNLYDPFTGDEVLLAHHSTGSVGTAAFEAAAGTYDLRVVPPAGTAWLPLVRSAVVVSAPSTSLGTLTLTAGAILQGFVKSASPPGAGIDDVNVNLDLPGTKTEVPSSRDHSDFTGHFSFAAAPGTYDAEFLPPAGTRYLPLVRPGVAVPSGGLTLSDTLLQSGFLLTGRTLDAANLQPVVDVNLELFASGSGAAVLTAHDHTAFDGRFETTVAAGSYNATFIPKIGSPYAVRTVPTGAVSGDLSLGDVLLSRGFFIGGRVRNASLQPVADVVVTVALSGSGTPVPVARNVTDAAGLFDWMALPAGTYDFTFTPTPASGLQAKTVPGVAVSADNHSLLDVILDPAPPPFLLKVTRLVTGGAYTATVRLTWTSTGQPSYKVLRALDPAALDPGNPAATLPGTTWDFTNEAGTGTTVYYAVE